MIDLPKAQLHLKLTIAERAMMLIHNVKKQVKPVGVPRNTNYSHTVYGVSRDECPLCAVEGRYHFNKAPVPVFKVKRRHYV